jgi:hypothetical protein
MIFFIYMLVNQSLCCYTFKIVHFSMFHLWGLWYHTWQRKCHIRSQVLSSPQMLCEKEINVSIYLFSCSILEVGAFSEICILLHCLPLRELVVGKIVRRSVLHMLQNCYMFWKEMGGVCHRTQGLEPIADLVTCFLVVSCNFVNQ